MTPGQRYQALLAEIPAGITLIAVSKGHPWEELRPLYEAGAHIFGESRLQEAAEKMAQAPSDIEWHLIGTLQRKKVAKAVGTFALIHSVDTPELADKIASVAQERGLRQRILLQVNTSGEPNKHGLSIDAWRQPVETLMSNPHLQIEGLMTMAPMTEDEATIRQCFAKLRQFKEELGLQHLSMGMSHDYKIAIQEGATMLRIGSALFE